MFNLFRRRHALTGEAHQAVRPPTGPPAAKPEQPPAAAVHPSAWVDSQLGDEVEAFLHGRLAHHLAIKGRTPPPWVAMNRLAHGDRSELLAVVAGTGSTPQAGGRQPWADTERFLAARLLSATGSEAAAVRAVQEEVLVPLELAIIDDPEGQGARAADVLLAAGDAIDARSRP